MKSDNTGDILEYYQREISYLRKSGLEFAKKYPKIAARLELSVDQSPDPHVERLLESFAFLTARIQKKIDGEFPEVTSALLSLLYPHYLNPTPSMAIARFKPDPKQGKLTAGYTLPKHTQVNAASQKGINIKFRTCYPVNLLPVEVEFAGFESTAKYDFLDTRHNVATVLRLRIKALGAPMREIAPNTLRFYLNGEKTVVNVLYELLFCNVAGIALLSEDSMRPIMLPEDSITDVGFAADEEALPFSGNSHPQYRLLQEYFAFPEKFLFFDLHNLDRHDSKNYVDILFLLDQTAPSRLAVSKDTFQLGCAPIINLFPKISEPIRLDHRRSEYQLVPDMRREFSTEVYSIQKVSAASDVTDSGHTIDPFFSYRHSEDLSPQDSSYWYARMQLTGRDDLPGTEMYLSFLDLNYRPVEPPTQIVYAHTLCMNRHLAEQIPVSTTLTIEQPAPVTEITNITKPTPQLDPPYAGASLWRLISHLSLNFLSLANGNDGLMAFREILQLYNISDDPSVNQQIAGIEEMTARRVVRRIGNDAWRGFCRGYEITLRFNNDMYVGGSAFALASVLNRFFALYTSVNSFTQLVIRSNQRKGEWKRWQPMTGEQIVL
ncbi:type VI secretion system baseplate subunit TssF [Ignavibacteria bacterium]|nr:type VI secretion system baseplate subunit TssF [Bacteroidota bacterium]